MTSALESAAANVTLPTSTTSDGFAATGVNTGGLDLSAFQGLYVWIKASEECSIRASSVAITTAAGNIATIGDMKLQADTDYSFRINKQTVFVSVFGGATGGTLFVAGAEGGPT